MKQFLTFILLICGYVLCGAQATSLTVDNKVAGTLSQRILYDDKQTVENLTILGEMNASDFAFIKELNSQNKLTGSIDLSKVTIVTGGSCPGHFDTTYSTVNNELNVGVVETSNRLKKLILPESINSWNEGQYSTSNGSAGWSYKYPNINADSLIINCPNLAGINNGIGNPAYLFIGEGMKWISIASKYMDRPPGASDNLYINACDSMCIHLPKSLTSLTGNARMGTPKMCIYSKVTRPDQWASSSSKWYDVVLTKGVVYAPNDTKKYYESSIFKNLTIISPTSVKSLTISTREATLRVGETLKLNALISPQDADNKSIRWESSDLSIAVVDDNGNITALKRGEVSIKAISLDNTDITAECKITVIQPVSSIKLNHIALQLEPDEAYQLIATISPDDANNKAISWISTNEIIAKVSNNGIITAIKPGKAIIRAITEDGGFTAECAVTVVQPVASVTISPKSANLIVGKNATLSASVLPTNADDKSITWSSSDSSIASVSENGVISAVSPGVAQIYASSNYNPEIKDFCEVTVIQPVTGLNLDKNEMEMVEDESTRLQATVLPDNASNKKVNWTSSDISIAMVSGDGTVYAIKAGQATIMATSEDGGFVALCKVTVKPKTILAESISFNTSASKLAVGESLQLTASISPENATSKTLKWSSTNTSVATVDASGLVSAIAQGTTQIIATTTDSSNLSAICDITVEKQFVYVSDLQITPASKRLAIGETFPLDVIIKPSDATNKSVVWSSTNPGVASVSKEGLVTAASEGEAIIIASSQDGSNLSSTCNVTVYNNVILVSSIALDKEVVNGYPNETIQLTASVLPDNASNKALVWNSTNPSVADIDNNGLLTLLQKGSANITAASTDGSKIKAHCAVFVSGMSGIDPVIIDKSASVKIYNSTGILVFDGVYSDANLTPGIYIILYNGERFKTKL